MSLPTELRYLESAAALRRRITALRAAPADEEDVQFASACLLQGRLFWDSAAAAQLETRPLLLYYAARAFGAALVAAVQGKRDWRGHGMSVRDNQPRIGDLRVTVQSGGGFFHAFNDAAAPLTRLTYERDSRPVLISTPTATSAALSGLSFTLEDCLARCPSIIREYELGSGERSMCVTMGLTQQSLYVDRFELTASVDYPIETYPSLCDVDAYIRRVAPFLRPWALTRVDCSPGVSWLRYENFDLSAIGRGPLEEMYWSAEEWTGRRYELPGGFPNPPPVFAHDSGFGPIAGDFGLTLAAIAPIHNVHVSEYSIYLLGLYALSSMVRYQPDTWTACVHRRPIADKPVDDEYLALIEAFMESVSRAFPTLLVRVLIPD